MSLQDYRQKFPEYNDISDEDLAFALHKKYYPEQPYNDFLNDVGLTPPPPEPVQPKQPSKLETMGAALTQGTLGMAESIFRTPQTVNRMLGTIGDVGAKLGIKKIWNPLDYLEKGITIGGKHYMGTTGVADEIRKSMGQLPQMFKPFERFANKTAEADQAFNQALQGRFNQIGQVVTDPEAWMAFTAQAIPSLMAAWKSGGSLPFVAWLEGMESASNAADFEKRTGQKISDADFANSVMLVGTVNGLLEKTGIEKIMGGKGSALKRFFFGGFWEGGTEGMQAFSGNVGQRIFDPEASLTQGILPSAIGGYGAGGGLGSMQAPPQPAMYTGLRSKQMLKSGHKKGLMKAQDMQSEGATEEEIRRETGWFQGPDYNWRYEITDSKARFSDKVKDTGTFPLFLEEMLEHPTLYKHYPGMRNLLTTVTIDPNLKSSEYGGQYTEGTPDTRDYYGLEPEIRLTAPNKKVARSMLLHELQHRIQHIEGFARGGNPQEFRQARDYQEGRIWTKYNDQVKEVGLKDPALYEAHEAAERFDSYTMFNNNIKEFDENRHYREQSQKEYLKFLKANPEIKKQRDAIWKKYYDALDKTEHYSEWIEAVVNRWYASARKFEILQTRDPDIKMLVDPREEYQNLFGEGEARDVQDRRSLTKTQRSLMPPYINEIIKGHKREDWIIRPQATIAEEASMYEVDQEFKERIRQIHHRQRLKEIAQEKKNYQQALADGHEGRAQSIMEYVERLARMEGLDPYRVWNTQPDKGPKNAKKYVRDQRWYHGTYEDFEGFAAEPPTRSTENETNTLGIWLTNSAEAANQFADRPDQAEYFYTDEVTGEEVIVGDTMHTDNLKAPHGEDIYFRDRTTGGNIIPIQARVQRPLVFTTDVAGDAFEKFMDWRDQWAEYIRPSLNGVKGAWRERMMAMNPQKTNEKVREYLKKNGYDSILIKDTRFDASRNEPIDQLVVMEPKKVKSIFAKPTSRSTKLYANPLQAIAEGYRKEAQKVVNWAEQKLAPLSALGRLPNKDVYLKARYRTMGRISNLEELASKINNTFSKASEQDQQAIYSYLTSRDGDAQTIQDPATRHRAQAVKRLIDRTGRRLVDYGIIPEESYEKYAGEYLPRVYLKYTLGESAFRELGTGRVLSPQSYAKPRAEIPEDIRQIVLGEITDPGYLAARAVTTPERDLAIIDFLSELSEHQEWISPKFLTQVETYNQETMEQGDFMRARESEDGRKVSAYWLKNEAERLAEQALHMQPEAAAKTRALAKDYASIANKMFEQGGKVPDNYKQIPNNARYGPLRGLYVRKEIYNDLIGQQNIVGDDAGLAERLLGQGGAATRYTQAWKASKVALNYPTQVRNFVSNGILLHLSGVPFHKVPARVIQAIQEIRTNGKHYRVAKKYGVKASSFSNQEILRIERHMLRVQQAQKGKFGLPKLLDLGAGFVNFHGDLYQLSESLFKTAKIIDAMEREGKSEGDAALDAMEALFDYSLIPQNVRFLRNNPIGAPFLTFYYKAAGQLAKVAALHPERLAPYVALQAALKALVQGYQDIDDEDWETLKATLPTWLQERGGAPFLPVKDEHGRWQAVSIGYFFPWQLFTEAWQEGVGWFDKDQAKPGELLQTTGLLGGPVPNLISAIQTGVDPFTKQPIFNENDPAGKQLADAFNYLWRLNMPTYMTDVGALGHTIRALEGYKDPRKAFYGEPKYTTSQALARFLGVNIYPVDPEKTINANLLQMKYELLDLRKRAQFTLRDPNMSEEERQKYLDWFTAEMTARQLQVVEYQEKVKRAERLSK